MKKLDPELNKRFGANANLLNTLYSRQNNVSATSECINDQHILMYSKRMIHFILVYTIFNSRNVVRIRCKNNISNKNTIKRHFIMQLNNIILRK